MSIFDSATPLDRKVTKVTANLYWAIPTDPVDFVRAHTDDLDLAAVVVRDNGDAAESVTYYHPRSSYGMACYGMVCYSGENVDGRGKKGAPRAAVTVNVQGGSADAIFFVAKVIEGAELHHSQNSRLTICADSTVLNSTEISGDTRMNNMRSALLGALLRSPEGIWHYAPQMITTAHRYIEDILPVAYEAYTQMMRR